MCKTTHGVVELQERPVLPERVGVRHLDAEAFGNVVGPPAPTVLHQVARNLRPTQGQPISERNRKWRQKGEVEGDIRRGGEERVERNRGRCTQLVHDRCLNTIGHRISTMPGTTATVEGSVLGPDLAVVALGRLRG